MFSIADYFFLDPKPFLWPKGKTAQVLLGSLIGNLVKFEGGPAAVIGDERREKPLAMCEGWEGAASRVIRKPEDLSECCADASWTEAICHKIGG